MTATDLRDAEVRRGRMRVGERLARALVRGRYVVVTAWVAIALGCQFLLPGITDTDHGVDGLIDLDSPPVLTEIASATAFGFPLFSRVIMVQRDPEGLSAFAQAEAVLRAAGLSQGGYGEDAILGALPVLNTAQVFPGSREEGTTALTYVFTRPTSSMTSQTREVRQFAATHLTDPDDAYVGVTGSVPARAAQAGLVLESLPLVETATLAAVVSIVAFYFRSIVAPLLALFTAGIAFIVTIRLAGLAGTLLGISVPSELEPLLVAMLLGVVTDYVIFFLSGHRAELLAGRPPDVAALLATRTFAPIVAAAGLTVAAGTASLVVAESALFRAFGPGMALAVLVALAVSVTLVPALLAILGRFALWPSRPSGGPETEAVPPYGGPPPHRRAAARTAALTRRPVAWRVFGGTTAALAIAALPMLDVNLGLTFIASLPDDREAEVAAAAATEGFADGVLGPTVLLLQGDDVGERRDAVARLESLVEDEPGVAGVLGPGDIPTPDRVGLFVAPSGDAARFLVVLDDTPLGAEAVDTLTELQERLPVLLDRAGLESVSTGFAGDTAIAAEVVTATQDDFGRIALTALAVNLVLLILFLRALVAPLYLLACSVLALVAALGLTTFFFQTVLGQDGLTFYVPFAAAVLLVALGSDYNIFGVGHIWQEARRRPLREAIIVAVPQTSRAITAAGITLAVSFGLLALVPLRPFAELAFALFVGILIDALVVRSLLVPSLLVLVGPRSAWPSRALSRHHATGPGEPEDVTQAAGLGGARSRPVDRGV